MKKGIKIVALALALLTVISLFAGCNKNKEDDTGMPAFVFKPEYNEAKINSEDFWIQGFAAGSDAVYFWASVADGERERKSYDYDENGNAIEQSYMSTTYVCRLFRADKDGKNAEMLPNFGISTDYTNEGAEERGVSMSSFFVSGDGIPGMIRVEDFTIYDLPEGLSTSLKERGGGLSEGMLLRLAVARALLSDRPILLLETFRLFGGEGEVAEPFMAGIEMIHTHSLIHDDLPAIDNDDYRRGRLTTHKVYGEAMGVLSGVSLLNYAYETMLRAFSMTEDSTRVIRALQIMADRTGIYGMLGGQSVDVENDGKPIDKATLDYIYEHKTSALLEASMMTGAVLAGADEEQTKLIGEAASAIGLAFQIQDDILDVTCTSEELGKPAHSDEKNNKVTYVTLFGIEEASAQVKKLSEKAVEILDRLNNKNEFLEALVREMAERRK